MDDRDGCWYIYIYIYIYIYMSARTGWCNVLSKENKEVLQEMRRSHKKKKLTHRCLNDWITSRVSFYTLRSLLMVAKIHLSCVKCCPDTRCIQDGPCIYHVYANCYKLKASLLKNTRWTNSIDIFNASFHRIIENIYFHIYTKCDWSIVVKIRLKLNNIDTSFLK